MKLSMQTTCFRQARPTGLFSQGLVRCCISSKKGAPQWIVTQRLLSAFTMPWFKQVIYKALTEVTSTQQQASPCLLQQPIRQNRCHKSKAPSIHIHAISTDSDLEAFNRNPTGCNFAAILSQVDAFANCLNEVFLSYWLRLPSHRSP